jgi:hypothetical protein
MLDLVARERGTLDGFDVALPAFPGGDMDQFASADATWALWHFYPPHHANDIIKAVTAVQEPASGNPAQHHNHPHTHYARGAAPAAQKAYLVCPNRPPATRHIETTEPLAAISGPIAPHRTR